jgi:hypothetical protein
MNKFRRTKDKGYVPCGKKFRIDLEGLANRKKREIKQEARERKILQMSGDPEPERRFPRNTPRLRPHKPGDVVIPGRERHSSLERLEREQQ